MASGARILLIRLGGLGDVVFTLPAVNAVRAAFPDARLTFLVDRQFAPLVEGFTQVDTILRLDRAGYKKLNPRVLVGGTFSLLWKLVASRFMLAVDFQGFGETAWLTWWSGAPRRWGSVYRPNRSWAYTRPVRRNTAQHPVDYNLELLHEAGGLKTVPGVNAFTVTESAMSQARKFFHDHNLDPRHATLLLHPFTSTPGKNWPLELYLEVARRGRANGMQIVFSGGPADRPALEPARQAGFAVAAGTPLLVSAGLAGLSTVVIGGDTGLPHLAAMMGKRIVMIMRSVEPGACYPCGHPEWAVVAPSVSPVSAIPVDAVWSACLEALADVERWLAPDRPETSAVEACA